MKRHGIDITVVLFYPPGHVPARVYVPEITLPLQRHIPGYITGLSGHQRLNSMMFARQYADSKKLEMLVIDLLADFDRPLYPKVLPLELLKEHDVLSLFRATKDLITRIASYWKAWVIEDEGTQAEQRYDWRWPADFVAQRPDFVPRLLQQSEFKHIHLLTHPANTLFYSEPLTVTSFRTDYSKILSATARFHPEVEVFI